MRQKRHPRIPPLGDKKPAGLFSHGGEFVDGPTGRRLAGGASRTHERAASRGIHSSAFSARLNGGLILLVLVVVALAATALASSKARYEARAVTNAKNLSRLLMQDLDASFDKIDLAVLSVKEEVERQTSAGGIDRVALNGHIDRQVQRQSDLLALRVTDSRGEAKFGTGMATGVAPFSISQRAFFKRLRDDPRAGVVFSEPVVGQVSGKWSIVAARRVSAAGDAFDGVVYGVVLLEHFQQRFALVDLGAHGVVSLRDLALGTVVRYPEPEHIGSTVGSRIFSRQWPEKLKVDPRSGTYFAVGLDGRNRALAYNRITEYPFYLIVGLYPGDYLQPWTLELWSTVAGVVLFSLVSLALARALQAAWRHREIGSKRLLELKSGALMRSEDKLQLALDSADMGLWMFTPGDGSCSATARAKALHGLSREDCGDLKTMLCHVVASDVERAERAIEAAVAAEPRDIELQLQLPDGTSRWIAWSVRWVPEGPGHPPHVVAVLQDVTHRINSERELRQDQHRKDEFLATLSHELRNPLAPIRTAFEVMRRSRDADVIEKARSIIDRQLGQLFRLVDDLLDVSRITQGKMRLHTERLSVATVLELALETSRPLIDAAAHRLKVHLPAEPLFVAGDLTRLAQVFSNLLNNAARYTPPGGDIAVTVSAIGHQAIVEIADNGIGVAPDVLPHLFEMFMQAERSAEQARGGLGVGLGLVKRLVEMHGGSVEVRSEGLGLGSSFVVRLVAVTALADRSMS
jgi:PAS domain S-box-containing protein